MSYLNWDTKTISDFSPECVEKMYGEGYVFSRVDRGIMNKTRSLRIKLSDFEMSSENRRIARKSDHIAMNEVSLPYKDYSWEIAKLAKDFYEALGATFTANKVKELMTDSSNNFNTLLIYTDTRDNSVVGYCIAYKTRNIFHYSYPFYKENPEEPSRGLGMMIKAIEYAKSQVMEYIYLGSLQRPSDTYKLQFKGMEWFNSKNWQTDIAPLREILTNA